MLTTALRLRTSWKKVLNQQLGNRAGQEQEDGEGTADHGPHRRQVALLTRELQAFLKSEVSCSLGQLSRNHGQQATGRNGLETYKSSCQPEQEAGMVARQRVDSAEGIVIILCSLSGGAFVRCNIACGG